MPRASDRRTRDPQWYRDAVVYSLPVRAFCDGNGDGVGDFTGLISRLDYLQQLGVTCLWLLPFYESPRRDDGYDVAHYERVHPECGTLDDFDRFLAEAHRRDLTVIADLVINHTSDQHAWFQAARRAPAGSPAREFYVWSDTDRKYAEARIIFRDAESSNWTWDPEAGAYFWHRFYRSQPDLNFDNPAVQEAVLAVMRFWLDRGVDALRLDAIPYLYERDGTRCENLPETHAYVRRMRAALDAGYAGRALVAEATSDPGAYLAADECHLAFHFPLASRLFEALAREDAAPIVEVVGRTGQPPDGCQWATFLRNHDELTFSSLAPDVRDRLMAAYAPDRRMRLNRGIRRRLAPLLARDPRRLVLAHALLLTLPGTPVLYYGDEIAMDDDVDRPDRDGLRTPMDWDRAASAQADTGSLWHAIRALVEQRCAQPAFARGACEFPATDNPRVLTFIRSLGGEEVLVSANLAGTAQNVTVEGTGVVRLDAYAFTTRRLTRRSPAGRPPAAP